MGEQAVAESKRRVAMNILLNPILPPQTGACAWWVKPEELFALVIIDG
jgi:hypothetical protein